jgi:hypothetical protein
MTDGPLLNFRQTSERKRKLKKGTMGRFPRHHRSWIMADGPLLNFRQTSERKRKLKKGTMGRFPRPMVLMVLMVLYAVVPNEPAAPLRHSRLPSNDLPKQTQETPFATFDI